MTRPDYYHEEYGIFLNDLLNRMADHGGNNAGMLVAGMAPILRERFTFATQTGDEPELTATQALMVVAYWTTLND